VTDGLALDDRVRQFYDVIYRRRSAAAHFTGEPVMDDVLMRILAAAHAAPSVGFTQPWDFILVRENAPRRAFWEHVQEERSAYARTLMKEQAESFAAIKVEAILESPLSIVVTYDPLRGGPHVFGRATIDDAGLYSVCMAIENLWLAATAEDIGVNIVTFFRESFVRDLLKLPDSIRPVSWLCIGPVEHFEDGPDLQRHGWRRKRPLEAAIHEGQWQAR
jgi:5,6-dimethylbenzimidazole synthase